MFFFPKLWYFADFWNLPCSWWDSLTFTRIICRFLFHRYKGNPKNMSCVLPEIGSDSAKSSFWWFYFFLPGFWGIELGFWKLTGLRRWNVPTKLWRQPVLDTIRQNQGLPSQDLMVFQKVGKVSWLRCIPMKLQSCRGWWFSPAFAYQNVPFVGCWAKEVVLGLKFVLRLALHRHLQCRPIWPGRPAPQGLLEMMGNHPGVPWRPWSPNCWLSKMRRDQNQWDGLVTSHWSRTRLFGW